MTASSQQFPLNLERCFIDGQTGSTEIICEVTDTGTGRKAVTKTLYDPSAPGFQLIPLRPAFTSGMKELLFAVVPVGSSPLCRFMKTERLHQKQKQWA